MPRHHERKPWVPTPESADAVTRGEIQLYMLDKPSSRRLTRKEMSQYEEAKRNHYVVAHCSSELSDAYYRWCEGANVPFVRVIVHRRYAEIFFDAIFLHPTGRIHPAAVSEIEGLFDSECRPPWSRTVNDVCSWANRVPRENVPLVAASLWRIITAPRETAAAQP